MLSIAARVEFVVCWFAWIFAFAAVRRRIVRQAKVVRARASVWGIVLQGIGFAIVFGHPHPFGVEKSDVSCIVSMVLSPVGVWLAWAATRHLGKQWRFEAALSADHELIQTGPYRWIRHPIYASMLVMLLAGGCALARWPTFLAGLCFFIIGIEIRVWTEDRLLAGRFQARFDEYRSHVHAYIPFIR